MDKSSNILSFFTSYKTSLYFSNKLSFFLLLSASRSSTIDGDSLENSPIYNALASIYFTSSDLEGCEMILVAFDNLLPDTLNFIGRY